MERKIENIDEFKMDENETPILPTGLSSASSGRCLLNSKRARGLIAR